MCRGVIRIVRRVRLPVKQAHILIYGGHSSGDRAPGCGPGYTGSSPVDRPICVTGETRGDQHAVVGPHRGCDPAHHPSADDPCDTPLYGSLAERLCSGLLIRVIWVRIPGDPPVCVSQTLICGTQAALVSLRDTQICPRSSVGTEHRPPKPKVVRSSRAGDAILNSGFIMDGDSVAYSSLPIPCARSSVGTERTATNREVGSSSLSGRATLVLGSRFFSAVV